MSSPANCESDSFWLTHFKTRLSSLLFPPIYDSVFERFRSRHFAVFSLISLLITFFYTSVFNPPGEGFYCTQEGTYSPIMVGGVVFKGIYVWLWVIAAIGNLKEYQKVWYYCGSLWVAWACGCISVTLAKCGISFNLRDENSVGGVIFVIFAATHYFAAYYWIAQYAPRKVRHVLSPLHWLYRIAQRWNFLSAFKTPVPIQVALFLTFWSLLSLFVSVPSTQSLQSAIVLFEFTDSVSDSLPMIRQYIAPFPYAFLLGSIFAFLINLFAFFSLYYNYRKAILRIVSEGSSCQLLKDLWRIPCYNGLFFACTD